MRKPAKRVTTLTKVTKEATPNQVKFDLKLELVKMDVEVDHTCIMRALIRNPGVFKTMSKKYRVPEPADFANSSKRTFKAYVEFIEDVFNKTVALSKNGEASFAEKKILFEVLVIKEDKSEVMVHTHEIELSQYAASNQPKTVEIKDDSQGPVTKMYYNI